MWRRVVDLALRRLENGLLVEEVQDGERFGDLIRMMASTDATPFLEKGDGFWDSVAHFEETGEADDSGIDAYDALIDGDGCFV